MKTLSIAFILLFHVACTTTAKDPTFTYFGEQKLSKKKIERKHKEDKNFCKLAIESDDSNQSRFIDCMITHDWQLSELSH